MALGVLFDLDGTLVDSNYLHVVAWSRAFDAHGHRVPMAEIHSLIGQGSDRLVATILGREDDAIVEAHADFYGPSLYQLSAFDGAAALLQRVKADGFTVVLATSASEGDVEHLRRAIDADDAIDHVTTKDDADASKPAPDILMAALDAMGLSAADCVFVGDSIWDVKAASAVGIPTVGVLTGGIHAASLRDAGAAEIHDSVGSLLEAYETTLISRFRGRAG